MCPLLFKPSSRLIVCAFVLFMLDLLPAARKQSSAGPRRHRPRLLVYGFRASQPFVIAFPLLRYYWVFHQFFWSSSSFSLPQWNLFQFYLEREFEKEWHIGGVCELKNCWQRVGEGECVFVCLCVWVFEQNSNIFRSLMKRDGVGEENMPSFMEVSFRDPVRNEASFQLQA